MAGSLSVQFGTVRAICFVIFPSWGAPRVVRVDVRGYETLEWTRKPPKKQLKLMIMILV